MGRVLYGQARTHVSDIEQYVHTRLARAIRANRCMAVSLLLPTKFSHRCHFHLPFNSLSGLISPLITTSKDTHSRANHSCKASRRHRGVVPPDPKRQRKPVLPQPLKLSNKFVELVGQDEDPSLENANADARELSTSEVQMMHAIFFWLLPRPAISIIFLTRQPQPQPIVVPGAPPVPLCLKASPLSHSPP